MPCRIQEGRYSSRSAYPYEGYSDEESNTRSDRARYQGQKGYSRTSDVSGAPKRSGTKPGNLLSHDLFEKEN